jgi:hypothetical protein
MASGPKGLVRNGMQGHVMLLHEKCRYFSIPTLSGASTKELDTEASLFLRSLNMAHCRITNSTYRDRTAQDMKVLVH